MIGSIRRISNTNEVGYAISSRDFLVYLDGMPSIRLNDMVVSDSGLRGWVSGLEADKVQVLLIDEGIATPGQLFRRLQTNLSIALGQFLLGRVVNPLGVPLDGKRMLQKTSDQPWSDLDPIAPGINMRRFITDQYVTGVSLVDTLIPLAKGQRELVLGDAHSGKTAFLIDLIANQRENANAVCIYASIGKPVTQLRNLIDVLTSIGALGHTVIVGSSSSDSAPLIYLTPQTAFTIAEFFQKMGKDVLVILDDIGVHAKIHREISLLLGKSPGRESYPGDIFYQHAHLFERAGNFRMENGGGSITALPVMELNLSDFSGYIPTNLIGMTDGHLFFKSSIRNAGQSPAIDISLSVTRVGRQTQNRLHNALAGKIRELLAQAEELESVSRFSAELPQETRLILKRKTVAIELISQESLTNMSVEAQLMLLGLIFTNFFLDKDIGFIQRNRGVLMYNFSKNQNYLAIGQKLLKMEDFEDLTKTLNGIIPELTKLCNL